MNPKPEHRITAVEKRVTHLEGTIEEMSSDTAEELKAVRRNIDTGFAEVKQELKKMTSFEEVSAYLGHVATKDDIKTLATKEGLASVKDDISKVHSRFDKVEGDIARLEGLLMQLINQKNP